MSIRESELFHGGFVAKLLKGAPEAVRLIEHNKAERAVYEVHGLPGSGNSVIFYVKYSLSPRASNGMCSWSFTFMPEHLAEIRNYVTSQDTQIALVCGRNNLKERAIPMEICLLSSAELDQAVNLSSVNPVWARVDAKPSERLRLSGPYIKQNPLVIPRNRVDQLSSPHAV